MSGPICEKHGLTHCSDCHFYQQKSDKAKLGKAQQAALDALKSAGERGLTTMEGIAVAGSRFPARTHELRKLGHVITVERIPGERLEFRYVWRGFSDSKQLLLFTKAA